MKFYFTKNIGVLFLLVFIKVNAQVSFENAYPNLSFNFPVEIQPSIDGSNRMFIVEQPGIIKVFPNSSSVESNQVSTFLDISSSVSYSSGQEIGLLGLAFHPNFNSNGYVFVYYIDRPGNYRINIARYQVSGTNPNAVDTSTRTIIAQFTKNQGDSNHNGGKIAFGPDGYLYISIGDGGGGGDPQGNGQNLNTVFGSLLRIDIDLDGNNPLESNPIAPNGNYEIPSDNPRVGLSGLDELYAWGIRNTWKFSFDNSGRLWGADVGQNTYEEINLITRGGNYGWNRFEANSQPSYGSSTILATNPDIKPILNYDHSAGDVSITGGYVYQGSLSNPILQNRYIYGDYVSGRVWALNYNSSNGSIENTLLFKTDGEFISSFGLDEQGELFFSGYGSSARIFKITEQVTEPVTTAVNGIGEWKDIPGGTNGVVECVVEANDQKIYVAGSFTNVGGESATNIAVLNEDETWGQLSSGSNGPIYSLALSQDGNLFAAGDFSQIGGINANNIAFWDGSNWSAIGSGTNGPISKIKFDNSGRLIIGGVFSNANNITVNNIAQWQNGTWSALTDASTGITGTNNEIRSLEFDENNNLYVGGNFDTAGGIAASRIARWNGTNWSGLGQGTSGFVQAIGITSNYIYAGGNFAEANNQTVNRIARFNRNSNIWESLDNGLSGNVNAIEINGEFIYVGGTFETASEVTNINEVMNNVARWSEANGWEALGVDTNVGINIRVNALEFTNNETELFVGGNFSTAGSLNANNIALWSTSFCTADSIIPEYQVNGTWQNGNNSLSLEEGDTLILSILPNTVTFSITLPNGSVVNNDYELGSVSPTDSGTYIFTTSQGCSESFELTVNPISATDDDNDGVSNDIDNCPNTPNGETVDANGCSNSQLDDDNDGVSNDIDNCPNTPTGETVDVNGCSNSQLDDDNDGVSNDIDNCPNTPTGETVDVNGCTNSQLDNDTDGDGVSNANDQCPNTPTGEIVDVNGCSNSQLDDDNDGVSNNIDNCPNTPTGETVDVNGCSNSQLDNDTDGDGVSNANDQCPNTPTGEIVDANGCSNSQLDDDNDGVSNNIDNCPNTPTGESVDENGCTPSSLPADFFIISSKGSTCVNSDNGSISITAEAIGSYTATLSNEFFESSYSFTQNTNISDLPNGTYDLCLFSNELSNTTVCSIIIITEPEPLNVQIELNSSNNSLNLELNGSTNYTVEVNGKLFYTEKKQITIPLFEEVNFIKVSTDKLCQGIFEKTIFIENAFLIYPNPVGETVSIELNNLTEDWVEIALYSELGILLHLDTYQKQESTVTLNTTTLASGVYIIRLKNEFIDKSFKIVKP